MTWTRIVLVGVLLAGCVSIRPRVVSRKTQIENQVVGELARLERDLLLVSSVRGAGMDAAELSPGQREALVAMMNRAYRLDDVEALKRRQVAGEQQNGKLKIFPRRLTGSAREKARAVKLIADENRDREVVMRRIVDLNAGLTAEDLPEVQSLVHAWLVESSAPGTLYEDEEGQWVEILPEGVEADKEDEES